MIAIFFEPSVRAVGQAPGRAAAPSLSRAAGSGIEQPAIDGISRCGRGNHALREQARINMPGELESHQRSMVRSCAGSGRPPRRPRETKSPQVFRIYPRLHRARSAAHRCPRCAPALSRRWPRIEIAAGRGNQRSEMQGPRWRGQIAPR